MDQLDWYKIIVTVLGIALIIGGTLSLLSARFYSFLNKAFFFEKVSADARQKLIQYKLWQRVLVAGIMLFWGIAAIGWVFEWELIL
jgi:hypothetical protein